MPPQEVLAEALAGMEFELAASDAPALDFIAAASAGDRRTRLAWLVAAFLRLPCTDALRGTLFDAMQPFIVIRPGNSLLSRTFARGLPAPTYYHRDALTAPRRPARARRSAAACRLAAFPVAEQAAGRRCRPRGAGGARPRDRRDRARVRQGRALLRSRARHRARALHDAARPPRAARFARRHDAVQERRPRRLRRRLAVPRHVPDRRQRVRAVSRRRVGAPVRGGAARLPAMLRRRPVRRRAVAVRRDRTARACVPARSGSTTGSGSGPVDPEAARRAQRRMVAPRSRSGISHAGGRAPPLHGFRHRASSRSDAGHRDEPPERTS